MLVGVSSTKATLKENKGKRGRCGGVTNNPKIYKD
jgi:hypothetical protein